MLMVNFNKVKKIYLSKFISERRNMLPIDLQELLVLVDLHCNRVVEKEVLYDASSYFREIEKERVQEIRCLGCSQFF